MFARVKNPLACVRHVVSNLNITKKKKKKKERSTSAELLSSVQLLNLSFKMTLSRFSFAYLKFRNHWPPKFTRCNSILHKNGKRLLYSLSVKPFISIDHILRRFLQFFSRPRYSMYTGVSKNVGKLVNWRFLQAIKKKKIIDQINKHISKKARILHIYLSISRDIIFDEKNICSILFNTLSSKCINCSSTTLNKMKLYFYLINESFWKLSQESPIDFWDTLYMYIKWSRYFYFTRCGIYVGKIYVKISCGCCGICESVSTVAYSGINNVGGGG